mgnify:CR=1 FL=1
MNTNSNTYTVIYTTIVVVLVAAILALVSQKLGPMQAANEKAETVSQILTAAQFGEKEHWAEIGNKATLEFYKENIESSILVDINAEEVGSLDGAKAEIYSKPQLKEQNYNIKDGSALALPVYQFKNGVFVFPVYGAGLWGPIWGYIAVADDFKTIVGAYFDHESETPGLGGKIKDDPSFRAMFAGKKIILSDEKPFSIVKGGAPEGKENAVDAITGATMTSKGLDAAINTWIAAYRKTLLSGEVIDAFVEAVDAVTDSTAATVQDSEIKTVEE